MRTAILVAFIGTIGLLAQPPTVGADTPAKVGSTKDPAKLVVAASGTPKPWTNGIDDAQEASLMNIRNVADRAHSLCNYLACKFGVNEGTKACIEKIQKWKRGLLLYWQDQGLVLSKLTKAEGGEDDVYFPQGVFIYDKRVPQYCSNTATKPNDSPKKVRPK